MATPGRPHQNELEEIVAHEDRGRFIAITDAGGCIERHLIDEPMTKAYLESRGLDWR